MKSGVKFYVKYSKHPRISTHVFKVWQNRFFYLWATFLARLLGSFKIIMKESIRLLITRKINKLGFGP